MLGGLNTRTSICVRASFDGQPLEVNCTFAPKSQLTWILDGIQQDSAYV